VTAIPTSQQLDRKGPPGCKRRQGRQGHERKGEGVGGKGESGESRKEGGRDGKEEYFPHLSHFSCAPDSGDHRKLMYRIKFKLAVVMFTIGYSTEVKNRPRVVKFQSYGVSLATQEDHTVLPVRLPPDTSELAPP